MDYAPDLAGCQSAILTVLGLCELWGSFVPFMLGADPCVDYSLDNRTLLFDVDGEDWSDELLDWAGLDRAKLPTTVPSGTVLGRISRDIASELGMPSGVAPVVGAHDQCANAVGCGAVERGRAVYGMGTFFCITPVFDRRPEPRAMIERGLNAKHHAVPGLYVSFIYSQGGALLKVYSILMHMLSRPWSKRIEPLSQTRYGTNAIGAALKSTKSCGR
jgi:hypothetical protein